MGNSRIKEQPSHREMRIASIQKVIHALKKGIFTKNDIVNETKLSWGSCSNIINLLYEREVIIKTDNKIGTGRGRKTTEYHFNNSKNLLFGIEIREDSILCSIINWGEHEIFRHVYPLQETITHSNLASQVSSAYVHSLVEAGIKTDSIVGLSIALAGGVDMENKRWLFAPRIKSINNYNFNQLFKILPKIPYKYIEHDIHAQASSVIRQRGWDDSEYVFIHIGSGISMSIYNSSVYLGDRGFSGEIGHIPYPSSYCDEGAQSVESAISEKGIVSYINKKNNIKISGIKDIPESLKTDKSLIDYVFNAVKYILIVTTNILDPHTIIIGGSALEPFYPLLKEKIDEEIRDYTWANGPKVIKWYKHNEMFGALGTILNASSSIINSVIEEKLV